jgi:pimeloyl-ACP methyl ester carboxylesterase
VGLAYERVGAGPPLVLLHGIGHRRQAWYAVLGLLAPHRDLVLVDLPGHGESPPLDTAGRTVARALMDEILGLLTELDLDRPHLAGNSLGGRIALEAAEAGRAASVTAIAPAGFWRSSGELAYARAVDRAMEVGARIFRRAGPLLSRSTAGRALIYANIVSRPSRVSPEQARGDFAAFLAARSAINTILAAATPFKGSVPAEVARERLPSAHLVALPGCGHVPMTDDPRLVADVLLRGSSTAAGVVGQRDDVGYVGLSLHSVGTCALKPRTDVLDPPRGERQYEYCAFVGVRHLMCR